MFAKFCNDEVSTCDGESVQSSAGPNINSLIGGNDRISWVYLSVFDPEKESAVTLFEDEYCNGRSAAFLLPNG